jgi:hypothetical protein
MGQLKTDLIRKLKGLAPFEQIARLYEDPADFSAELNNYFVGGLVISTPTMFVMAKPIDSSVDPRGQWYAEKPDTWYVRWFAGEGALQAIMDAVNPLEKVMFQRVRKHMETDVRTYKWKRLYNLVRKKNHGNLI